MPVTYYTVIEWSLQQENSVVDHRQLTAEHPTKCTLRHSWQE